VGFLKAQAYLVSRLMSSSCISSLRNDIVEEFQNVTEGDFPIVALGRGRLRLRLGLGWLGFGLGLGLGNR
jgi:hypothetical protein